MDLTGERTQKITPRHLRRQAYLYVRQSTLRQVVENTEVPCASTRSANALWRWAGRLSRSS
jgi:hypothetical protein